MKIAVITGPGSVELREEPTPRPGPDQLVVEVAACGLCTMERRLFAGERQIYPVSPGHEVSGRVVDAGAAVASIAGAPGSGEQVTVDLLTRCGTCRQCRRGRSSICSAPQGGTLSDGTISMGAGLAEFVVVPAAQAWPVGEVSALHAAMGEPLACVAHSVRLSGVAPGDRVAVVGAGFMGRLHLALVRHRGAESVGMIDLSGSRLADAATAGAAWTGTPAEAGAERARSCDVVFVTAGAPGALETAVALLDDGGTVVLYGAFPKDLSAAVPPDAVHHHELSIVGAYSQEPADWRTAAALIRSGALAADLDALVTARFGLDRVSDALQLVSSSPTYRVLVEA